MTARNWLQTSSRALVRLVLTASIIGAAVTMSLDALTTPMGPGDAGGRPALLGQLSTRPPG